MPDSKSKTAAQNAGFEKHFSFVSKHFQQMLFWESNQNVKLIKFGKTYSLGWNWEVYWYRIYTIN